VTPAWRKSRRSYGAGECVEAAADGGVVLACDSSAPAVVLAFPAAAWTAFTRRLK
jgi:hypothetical protein